MSGKDIVGGGRGSGLVPSGESRAVVPSEGGRALAVRPEGGRAAAVPPPDHGSPPADPLIGDADESVRIVLANKLCRILPTLSRDARDQVFQVTLRALEALARDQAERVRAALASAIKDVDCAPPQVCLRLARDVERSVAEPILHYCVTLTDEDLLEIIGAQPMPWALAAIAARGRVGGAVATAIYETGDDEATAVLIDNPGAEIPEETLSRIIEDAVRHPAWQMKLAKRPVLPQRLAQRLAQFVDGEVMDHLAFRHDVDREVARDIVTVTRRRIAWAEEEDRRPSKEPGPQRARRLFQEGRLDDAAIGDALAWNQTDFVTVALALLAGCAVEIVEAVLDAQSARGVTALSWKAGLSMRTAIQIQARAARIPPRRLLNARDGTDYPLSEIEMLWHLEFFGVPT